MSSTTEDVAVSRERLVRLFRRLGPLQHHNAILDDLAHLSGAPLSHVRALAACGLLARSGDHWNIR